MSDCKDNQAEIFAHSSRDFATISETLATKPLRVLLFFALAFYPWTIRMPLTAFSFVLSSTCGLEEDGA